MAGERRHRLWAAAGIVLLTLLGAGVLGGFAAAGVFMSGLCFESPCPGRGAWVGPIVLFGLPAAACLVVGLVRAWKVGTGRAKRPGWGYSPERLPDGPGRTWLVTEPGAELARAIDGEATRRLDAGATVVEVQRVGEQVRVTTAEGLTGWVPADRLQPLPGPGGEGAADGW